eukprot:958584-Amphidinium_carterae.1
MAQDNTRYLSTLIASAPTRFLSKLAQCCYEAKNANDCDGPPNCLRILAHGCAVHNHVTLGWWVEASED